MILETLRFRDEYDYENVICSKLSSARARTSLILAGKQDCRSHSTTSFSENAVVTETIYSVRGFIILRQGDDLRAFTKDNTVNFLVIKKCNEAFRGVYNLRICEKTLSSRSRSRPRI